MKWATEDARILEWKIAKQYLKKDNGEPTESGTKIKRGLYLDKKNQTMIHLMHSFIIFSGVIFVIGDHQDYIKKPKKGSLKARIKYGRDEAGQLCGLKIQESDFLCLEEVRSENRIAMDVGASLPGGHRQIAANKWKCYSPYLYFQHGTLQDYILYQTPHLSIDSIYQLAIKAAHMVHYLHTGQSSSSSQKYAHLDIKPANIVLTHSGTLRFIDFGCSDVLEGQAEHFRGTVGYLPINPLSHTKQSIDIFGLLRILYMPMYSKTQAITDETHAITGDLRYSDDAWIFPDDLVMKTPRLKTLVTKANDRNQLTLLSALDIMRELTLLRCNLDDSYQESLLSETAIYLTNRLFSQRIPIRKDYLEPENREIINSWGTINERDLQQFISHEEEKKYWALVVIATLISPVLGLLALLPKKK